MSTAKWVLNQDATFKEKIQVAKSKAVTIGETAAYKIVQQSTDAAETSFIAVGHDENNEAKLTTQEVQIKSSTATTKLLPNKVEFTEAGSDATYLSGTGTEGLKLATGVELKQDADENLVLSSAGAKLTIVSASNNDGITVGPHTSKAELKFESGNSGHEGFIPILDGNHMIPTEYLSNAFAFDGKLIFRRHIFLEYEASPAENYPNWRLAGSMTKTYWYTGAQGDLDPGGDTNSPPDHNTEKYWNYAFATGSYFLVNFDTASTTNTPPDSLLPANITLGDLLTLLSDANLLDQYNDDDEEPPNSLTSWYAGDESTADNFVTPSQSSSYKVSQSDMIVIRNKGYGVDTASSWKNAIEVTVIDNSDEFQKRLVNANDVKFPTISDNTLNITNTAITGSSSGQTSFHSESIETNAIRLHAEFGGVDVDAAKSIHLTSSEAESHAILLQASNAAGGVDIVAGSTGVDVDAKAGAIDLDVMNSAGDTSLGHIGITTSGRVNIDADGQIDMDSSNASNALHNDGVFATTPAIHLNATAGGVGIKSADEVVLVASKASTKALDFLATDTSGGMNFETGDAGKFVVTVGSQGFDVDSKGDVDIQASEGLANLQASTSATVQAGSSALVQAGTGDATLKSTSASVLVEAGQGAEDAIKLNATGADAGIQAVCTGAFAVDAEGSASIDGKTGVSLHASGTSDTATAELKAAAADVLLTATTKSVLVTAAEAAPDAIKLTATGADAGIQAVCNGEFKVDAEGAFTVDAEANATIHGATGVTVLADQSGDVAVTSSAERVYLTGGKASSDAFLVSAVNGGGYINTKSLEVGNSAGFHSMRLMDQAVISMNEVRVMGALKSSVGNVSAINVQLVPNKSEARDDLYQIDIKITARDNGTAGSTRKVAYLSASLIYKFKASSSAVEDRSSSSVSVEKYFIDGDVNLGVGIYNHGSLNTDDNGNLRIYAYWTGTAGSDFTSGGNWQLSYDVLRSSDDGSTFGANDHVNSKFVGFDNGGDTLANNEIGVVVTDTNTFLGQRGTEQHYDGSNVQKYS